MWRWAVIGAAILGACGFFGGIAICLSYEFPIPPLFTTELGILVGGSLGALAAHCIPAGGLESQGQSEHW